MKCFANSMGAVVCPGEPTCAVAAQPEAWPYLLKHIAAALLLFSFGVAHAARIEFVWPTPNQAWERGRPIDDFVQPTVSGDPESGLFGCVRTNGTQFHEGVDLKAIGRDRRGEPTDKVMAAMRGIVRHVNTHPGES